ncbi:MAG: LysE family translocator [Chloroflexi bacterium]|nr:LysE family translocator [Chloroflexota bacterium]
MTTFLLGLIIGISIAAPVGPIGVLCIRRTLTEGRLAGLVSGLGAASADAIYGVIAGFGLTFISGFLVEQQTWLRLLGGLFLCYLGVRTYLSRPSDKPAVARSHSLLGNYLSIFVLTLTNPITIISFAVIFAGLGLAESGGDYIFATLMVLGVFTGSALWWLCLSLGVGLFRDKVAARWMQWINSISGGVVFGFGVLALVSLIWPD